MENCEIIEEIDEEYLERKRKKVRLNRKVARKFHIMLNIVFISIMLFVFLAILIIDVETKNENFITLDIPQEIFVTILIFLGSFAILLYPIYLVFMKIAINKHIDGELQTRDIKDHKLPKAICIKCCNRNITFYIIKNLIFSCAFLNAIKYAIIYNIKQGDYSI